LEFGGDEFGGPYRKNGEQRTETQKTENRERRTGIRFPFSVLRVSVSPFSIFRFLHKNH